MSDLNPDPASTWGATADYKERWNKEYGVSAPAGNASKAEWVEHVQRFGVSQEDAEAMTVAEMKEKYDRAPDGSLESVVSPSEGTTYGSVEPGTGADSGTAEGTPSTSTSPATGTKGR